MRVTRGGVTESTHRVGVAVADARGALIGGCGDAGQVVFYRSAAKPFQSLPLVEDGVVERFGLTERELAVCCASHNAEPEHLALARGILAKAGLDEGALECGPHPPMRPERARELWAAGEEPGPAHNNCSGKHAGMLALAVARGWPTERYLEPGHPVQRRMLAEVSRWSGLEEAELATGTDGCGVVTFALPLARMAASFARFTAAADAGGPASRIVAAMTRHPFAVAGTGRMCTAVMERLGGRVFVKTGAEGVYCGGVLGRGVGFALKVEDGARRASDVALIRVLSDLGVARPADASALGRGRTEVFNTRGEAVGRIESAFRVRLGAWTGLAGTDGFGAADGLASSERSLVRVSAALASGGERALRLALAEAARDADPVEVEEALLQSYLFLGYPAALGALARWRDVSPAAPSAASPDDWRGWADRGARLCRRVYSTRYRKLRDNVGRLHPDLDRWMVVEGYGKVLGRPGLALPARECCIVALLAVAGAGPQLYSHLRGALNLGASAGALAESLEIAGFFMDDAGREAAWATWAKVLSRRDRPGRVRARPSRTPTPGRHGGRDGEAGGRNDHRDRGSGLP